MKRISKILSVLMVVAMLFSIAAVPASAIDHDSTATIKYVFKDAANGNVITKAEKGQVVWMYVVLNWNKNVLNFQGTFKWDKNVLTLVRKNGATSAVTSTTQTYNLCGDFARGTWIELTDADGDMFYQDDENNMMGGYTTYGAGTKTFNHNCTIAAWDAATKAQYQAYTFIYTSNLDDGTNQLLVNTKGQDLEFAQLCFKVNEDTTLDKAVISSDEAFAAANMNLVEVTDDQSWFFVPYAKTEFTPYTITPVDTTLDIVTAPSIVVSHVKQQSKWNKNVNKAENYLFGFVGQLSGIELTTTDAVGAEDRAYKKVNEIKSITATATIGTKTVTAPVQTVWAVEGGYQFRAQFSGFLPTDANTATVTFAVTMADGTTVYETAEASSQVISTIYANSVANGLPAVAA